VEKLKIENLRLKTELATTIAATEQLESGAVEARDEENRQHAEELNTLKKTIHTLKVNRVLQFVGSRSHRGRQLSRPSVARK